MAKQRFKLSMRCTEIMGNDGQMMRALIIATAPTPVKGWLQSVVACEDGTVRGGHMISVQDFELAERKQVTLMEVEGEAKPVIYGVNAA